MAKFKTSLKLPLVGMVLAMASPSLAQESEYSRFNSIIFPDEPAQGTNWTPQQFTQAKPIPMPMIKRKDAPQRSQAPKTPGLPRSGQKPAMATEYAAEKGAGVPLKWAGKMFFRKEGGSFVCSGQFIAERVVLTAAHCVQNRDTGRYVTDLVFALQYRNGKSRSQHRARCIATYSGWTSGLGVPERYQWDYAMFLVDKPSPTGNFGYHPSWRNDYSSDTLVGYPTKIAGGDRVIVVKANLDAAPYGDIAIASSKHKERNFLGGSSGGAWVARYTGKSGSGNYVIGVNSHYYEDEPTKMYSPYFTGAFGELLRYTENGCR